MPGPHEDYVALNRDDWDRDWGQNWPGEEIWVTCKCR
jgi:hypothetical protein